MMRGPVLFLLAACLAGQVLPQVVLSGRTVDDRTGEPLPFVNISATGGREGVVSDIDGRFTFRAEALPLELLFSYVGYEPLVLKVERTGPLIVRMNRRTEELREVVVMPGENPAHRIIRKAYEGRMLNDGMKQRAHRYRSYSRTLFTAGLDSARINDTAWIAGLDTNARETYDFFRSQHLLVIESATEKSFDPPSREQERVLAMRVSGLKDPSLLALAASTRTFSPYDPSIVLLDHAYLGPLAPRNTEAYLFILEDTLYSAPDTVFILSFRPRKGRTFDGLKGLLYIHTGGYAVRNVIMEPVEQDPSIGLKVQQVHERVNGTAWFPLQMNTTMSLPNFRVGDWALMGVGRTYLRDIEVDVPITREETRGPAFTAEHMETRREEAYWRGLREDTLGARELKTYQVIDSVGEAEHLDRKVKWFAAVTTGLLPVGPVSLELGRFLAYNNFEGLRTGAGLRTNDRVTRYASAGLYGAYGIGDDAWKWGGDLRIKPRPSRSFEVRGHYAFDVSESGGVAFKGPRPLFSPDQVRLLYMDRMDRIERAGGEVSFRLGGGIKAWLGTAAEHRVNEGPYRYATDLGEGVTLLEHDFRTGEVSVDLRFAFREEFAQLPSGQISMGTDWPVMQVSFMRAIPDLWGGERDLWRASIMIDKSFHLPRLGTPSFRMMAGTASADAPYAWLFNPRGSNADGFHVATPFAFETMRPDEFLADRYLALHFRHDFGRLLWKTRRFQPVPVLVSSACWSGLDEPGRHRGWSFNAMSDGFYESGAELLIRSGISTLGAGAYYRYGPNALPHAADNLVGKLAVGYVF